MPQIDKTNAIARYLLGDVSDAERDWVESQMLADEDFLDECLRIEDDLVDDYVLGHLTGHEQGLFESKFLDSPRRRHKLKLAQALVAQSRIEAGQVATSIHPQTAVKKPGKLTFIWRPVVWVPALAASLMVLALGLWSAHTYQVAARLRQQLTTEQQASTRLQQAITEQQKQQAQISKELESERAVSSDLQDQLAKIGTVSRGIVTLALLPSGFRGEGAAAKQVVVAPDTKLLRLELMIEPGVNYPSYRVTVQPTSGASGVTLDNLRLASVKTAEADFLTMPLQSHTFSAGDYMLTLEGRDSSGSYQLVSSYNFHVTKK